MPSRFLPGVTLFDIVGTVVESGGLLIIPAHFDFDVGSEGSLEQLLMDFSPDIEYVRACLNPDDFGDGTLLECWVRARIPCEFGFRPPACAQLEDRGLLNFPFLAVMPSTAGAALSAVPFLCASPGWDGPGLIFPKAISNDGIKSRIAAMFWAVLLRTPDSISLFEEWVYDPEEGPGADGAGKIWCERNWLTMSNLGQLDEPYLKWDPHLTPRPGELFRCPDCDGTGIDDFYPYIEDCPTCRGTGMVTW